MSSIPSVLCAVDLSSHSGKVIQHAGAVAEHFCARLVAATITAADSMWLQDDRPSDGGAADQLHALMRIVLPTLETWPAGYRMRIATGSPAATILQMARDEDVDLIVIGTRGTGAYRRGGLGSTTQGVLRYADVPVLVVPATASDLHSLDDRRELRGIENVLAPVDFGPMSRRDARVAAGIAATLGIPLLLVHVVPAGGGAATNLDCAEAREQLQALRSEILGPVTISTLVTRGQPAERIAELAAAQKAGLVVMGLRGAGGLTGPGPGAIAYRMLCLTPTMLLALPPSVRRPAWRRMTDYAMSTA
jgi:nucleotide-binding universal stress UspA family protein